MDMSEMLRPKVERGAALLDEKYPDWATQIDLDALDIANGDDCILGQLYGDYTGALGDLGLSTFGHQDADHGFNTSGSVPFDQGSLVLESIWREMIAARI